VVEGGIGIGVLKFFEGKVHVVVILEIHLLHDIEEVVVGGVGDFLLFEEIKRHDDDDSNVYYKCAGV
jgi:hypothetical protein